MSLSKKIKLSDQAYSDGKPRDFEVLKIEDVREAVKELKNRYMNHINKHFKSISAEFMQSFDEIFGEQLI